MKNDTMYKIGVKSLEKTGNVIHRFLTLELLTDPEFTVFESAHKGTNRSETMKTYGNKEIPSLIQIQQIIENDKTEGVLCVAATDKADIRGVVLSYLPGMEFIALSFPMAHNGLNDAEKDVLEFMSK